MPIVHTSAAVGTISKTVEHSVEGGRITRPTATEFVRVQRTKVLIPEHGITVSRWRGYIAGQGKCWVYVCGLGLSFAWPNFGVVKVKTLIQ